MSSAIFINKEKDITYTCNICSDVIDDNKIVGLKCDPTKHIFCYECIFSWYKQLKKKSKNNNYMITTMCPICRKNGGHLPIIEVNNQDINPNKQFYECGIKLSSKDGYCTIMGKDIYNGFCGKHYIKLLDKGQCDCENQETITTTHQCGVKLKQKNGFCKLIGKDIYNGFCGIHKNTTIS